MPCQFESVDSEPGAFNQRERELNREKKENLVAEEQSLKVLVVEDIQSNFFLVSSNLKTNVSCYMHQEWTGLVEIVRTQSGGSGTRWI